jgi:nicotinate-nucleotide adenylyltransferase
VIRPPPFGPGQRIGLFGGSFNPAHRGHLTVALFALKHLKLDWVWWLLSPQNPLKDPDQTDDYGLRLRHVRRIARHPRFIVTDIERQIGSRTTAETLRRIAPVLARGRFVWIMGADSFANLHRWHDWNDIAETLPLAFLARPGYSIRALSSPAAHRYAACRIATEAASRLAGSSAPRWVFIPMPLQPESSTAIRNRRKKNGGERGAP